MDDSVSSWPGDEPRGRGVSCCGAWRRTGTGGDTLSSLKPPGPAIMRGYGDILLVLCGYGPGLCIQSMIIMLNPTRVSFKQASITLKHVSLPNCSVDASLANVIMQAVSCVS
jgi:hypothetical protein